MSTLNNIAMEAISYQPNDSFPPAFAAIIGEMRQAYEENSKLNTKDLILVYGSRMEKLIKQRFGLKIIVDPDMWVISVAAVFAHSNDNLNRLDEVVELSKAIADGSRVSVAEVNQRIREMVKGRVRNSRASNGKQGVIDFKRAKVSGFYSEMASYLLLDVVTLIRIGLTDIEITAIALHELGHVFYGFEYHSRATTTNAIISDAVDALDNNDPDKAYAIYKYNFTKEELAEAQLSRDSTITDFYGVAVARIIDDLQSQYDSSFYDLTKFESLADNFASRMGMGAYVITSINKMNQAQGSSPYLSNSVQVSRWVKQAMTSILLAGTFGVAFGLFAASAIVGYITTSLVALRIVFKTGKKVTGDSKIYDDYKDRGLRLQRDINHILKDRTLNSDAKRELIAQWEILDSLNKTNTNYVNLSEHILRLVLPSARKAYSSKERQQQIEKLLNNDLFTQLTQIELLGDNQA